MKKQFLILLLLGNLIISCKEQKSTEEIKQIEKIETKTDTATAKKNLENSSPAESPVIAQLPKWVSNSTAVQQFKSGENYKIENRLNKLFLEEDFNGDGHLDVAFPIVETKTNKKGFAIIHGKTEEVFILGAGKLFNNALGDNQDYINEWSINRNKENEPGVEEETGNGPEGILILENPSIEISADEIGGGQIYWNGKEYAYFHQTC